MSWLKALALIFVVSIGFAAQPPPLPPLPAGPPTPPLVGFPPPNSDPLGRDTRPLSLVDQLRSRYLKVNSELVNHLPEPQLKQRVESLEKELAAAIELEQKTAKEQKAAEALEKARATLIEIATTYRGTNAGAQAQQALDGLPVIGPPPPPR
jgi:hypothetical protein